LSIAERKEREKEQRRNDILGAAEKLFFARGYDNVTMDDIAKAVELNKATIYLYFKDKESLYFTIVLRGITILHAWVRESESKAESGSEKLWEIGRAYSAFAKEYPDYNRAYNYFYSGRFELARVTNVDWPTVTGLSILDGGARFWNIIDSAANRASSEVAGHIIELNREIFALIRNAIKEGIEEGRFIPELDPEEAAVVFTLLLESVPRMRPDLAMVLDSKSIGQQKFARDVGDFMVQMLGYRESPSKKKNR
jgi:AcrR family transcriptional regulator